LLVNVHLTKMCKVFGEPD